jgi:hypothetical protein
MSYSFIASGATKKAAKKAVADEFDKMMGAQPMHSKDRAAALANAGVVIDLLVDDDTKGISVTCNGHVTWGGPGINGASISCTAYQVALP